MEFVLTPEQMAEADRAAIDAGTPVETLMERAGRALARVTLDVLGGAYGRRATIIVGKGNNGGDGRVATRTLTDRGVRTDLFRLDAELDRDGLTRSLGRSHVVIDAMFGTGFRGRLEGDAAFATHALNGSAAPVVACDIPTGVNGLTGQVDGEAVFATRTVTFAALKPGLVVGAGFEHAGIIDVAPIGVDPTGASGHPGYVIDEFDVGLLLPERRRDAHKWSVGGLFVVAGGAGMLGAANLVARSALRAGAGMVVLGVPGRELAARAAGGEVVTQALAETPEGFLDETAAKDVLATIDRFRSLVIGPGLGTDRRTSAAVRTVVSEAPVPILVDADGLNCLAGDLSPLLDREGPAVLTPHTGEFNRLSDEPVGADRLGAVRALAARTGAVVLLKGPTTLIADPEGRAVFNVTGGPWLASAGTGDVLSGIIGSLLAQGLDAFEAAAVGAWLHGAAADVAGHSGLVAGDLVEALPVLLARTRRPVAIP